MKKILFLALMFSAVSIFAQSKADFSGTWELDTINSKLNDRMRVESMTLTVTQTEKELKVVSTSKHAMPSDGGSDGGGMNRGGMSGEGQVFTYSLEGKETKAQVGGMMTGTATLKASLEADGKLNLSSVRDINTQMGAMTITVRETWELADDGKTLKVSREMESPRGTQNSEFVFTKSDKPDVGDKVVISSGEGISTPTTPKSISAGVVNSKAISLVKPKYPAEARAAKASGAVNVQVTIDENGTVISAKAVSGDTLLRTVSEEAAMESKFSPTLLQGVPVKVTGVIVYNFVP